MAVSTIVPPATVGIRPVSEPLTSAERQELEYSRAALTYYDTLMERAAARIRDLERRLARYTTLTSSLEVS